MATREDIDAIPSKYYETIAHYILGLKNLSSKYDLSKPMLRLSVIKIYPLLILIYSVLIAVGVAANFTMIIHISKNKLYRDPTYAYLINIAISDITKCILVLPITLAVLLIQNWVFGKFLCFSLAMIQVRFIYTYIYVKNIFFISLRVNNFFKLKYFIFE